MRRLFRHDSGEDYSEPLGAAAIAWQRFRRVGMYPVFFCLISIAGLVCGLFGNALVPGRFEIHVISYAEAPVWFALAMLVNGVVAVMSVGYFWFRVLGR